MAIVHDVDVFILLNSYFIFSSVSAIFRAFMVPPKLNSVVPRAEEGPSDVPARVASNNGDGGALFKCWMKLS